MSAREELLTTLVNTLVAMGKAEDQVYTSTNDTLFDKQVLVMIKAARANLATLSDTLYRAHLIIENNI
jgi:hypothetical protein